jgi:hypothetical protein
VYRPTKVFNIRKLWQFRYRVYSVVLVCLISTVLWSSNPNIKPDIKILGRSVEPINIFASKVSSRPLIPTNQVTKQIVSVDENDVALITRYKSLGFDVKLIKKTGTPSPVADIAKETELKKLEEIEKQKKLLALKPDNQKNLAELIPKPEVGQQFNLLTYPKYNITVPVIPSNLDDIFEKNPDGSINTAKPIEENVARDGPLGIPIQRLLVDGIVHMAFSPLPGELSDQMSSYIVGHSSNYPSVKSDYNTIFKPLESISQPGEEFTIFDKDGRELKFKVFETLKIAEEDSNEAYKAFPGRRVVTLQTSILGYKNGQIAATHRWLTRGELQR